jgi:hypothetical protein
MVLRISGVIQILIYTVFFVCLLSIIRYSIGRGNTSEGFQGSTCPTGTLYVEQYRRCARCAAGYYGLQGAQTRQNAYHSDATCLPCRAGRSSVVGATSCTDCPAGQSSISGGVCTPCPVNETSSTGGLCISVCGAFNGMLQNGTCKICPIGTAFVLSTNSCSKCRANYFGTNQNLQGVDATCTACPAGQTSTEGATSCTNCPAGKSSIAGQDCINCTYGRISISGGLCELCPAGKTANTEKTECINCPANTFSTGDSNCRSCPIGVTSNPGATSCACSGSTPVLQANFTCRVACPTGTVYVASTNSCSKCAAGYSGINQNIRGVDATCRPCEPGTYAPVVGSEICLDSPAGAWSGGAFATFVTNTIGYYSGSRSGTQRICPPGSYCPPNAVEPIPCPTGTFGSSSGLSGSNCSGQCPTGTFCGDSGHATPMECKAELE